MSEPQTLSDVAGNKARSDLDLKRLLEALAARCVSDLARELALSLPFLENRTLALCSLSEIDELRALDDRGESVPRKAVPIIGESVQRARIGASLALEEIAAIRLVLREHAGLTRYLRQHRQSLQALIAACPFDDTLGPLAQELERSLEDDGSISDNASGRLAELRGERTASRQRIVRKLDELVGRYASILSDSYWTERDGRYVLPVRSDAHDRVLGIVHGSSAGGATLFLEPRELVSMGNRHKMLDAAVAREEEQVLAALSAQVAAVHEAVGTAAEQLAHVDLRAAAARLAFEIKLTRPEIPDPETEERAGISLARARHPILALDGTNVVPSDLELLSGRILVVSGPNAGGKTVSLKTLGLAALLVRMGLPVPGADGSVVSWFDHVLTDVGDDQSLSKNLSTFSAHVSNLATIVARASPRVLVLLDEVASGTDPREGEALATAILERLADAGAAVACATHYEALKLLALTDSRFKNASVGFDLDTMSPTFELILGLPGPSSALAVARRFGIPPEQVARAESLLSDGARSVSALVTELSAERKQLSEARKEVEQRLSELRRQESELAAELQKTRIREQAALNRQSEELLSSVKRAREELRAAQAKLRGGKLDAAEVSHAARTIDRVAGQVAIGGALEPRAKSEEVESPPITKASVGMKVFVPRLRTEAEVLEITSSGQLRLAAGPLKLLVKLDEVRASKRPPPSKAKSQVRAPVPYDAAADQEMPMQTSDNSVDLRGLRMHEVLPMAEQFLDRCVGSGLRVAFLIHGHGTGVLRNSLRESLGKSVYVERFRPGEPREGGDGVTVVWLR